MSVEQVQGFSRSMAAIMEQWPALSKTLTSASKEKAEEKANFESRITALEARITALAQTNQSLQQQNVQLVATNARLVQEVKDLTRFKAAAAAFQSILGQSAQLPAGQEINLVEEDPVEKVVAPEPFKAPEPLEAPKTPEMARPQVEQSHSKLEALLVKVAKNPNDPELHYKIAMARLELGQYQKASVSLTLAEKHGISQKDWTFGHIKAKILSKVGKHAEAETVVRKLIESDPKRGLHYSLLAQIYLDAGKKPEAKANALKARDLGVEVGEFLAPIK